MVDNNEENEVNMNIENTEETNKVEDIKNEEISETINNGECWALVCYTEKTLIQRIVYNFKKLFKYTKERILGRA